MTIGQRVRERRTALGFSLDKVARESGLSWTAIQKLETGKRTDPHYSTLEAIAHALDITVGELVGEEQAVPLAEAPEPGRSGAREPEATRVKSSADLRWRVLDEAVASILDNREVYDAWASEHPSEAKELQVLVRAS